MPVSVSLVLFGALVIASVLVAVLPSAWTRRQFSRGGVANALLVAACAFVPLANGLYPRRLAPWYPFVAAYWVVVGGATILALVALASWRPLELARLRRAAARRVMHVPAPLFVGAAAVIAFVASAALAHFYFGRQPQDVDEAALLWHAKTLLRGRLSLPPDANPEFFGMDDMITQGRWYSQFPVGAPAFLAIGVAVRAAWLLNPALLALSVCALYQFARRAFGPTVGRLAAILLAVAPFVLMMSASLMSYSAVLLLGSITLWQLAVWADADSDRARNISAALLGLTLGIDLSVRPLDALALVAVTGVMQLALLRRNAVRLRSLPWQIAAGTIPLACLLYANARTTGAPLRFGYDVLFGGASQLGFHVDPFGTMHTPVRALAYLSKYLLELNTQLFGWPVPVFGVIVTGLLVQRRLRRWDYLLLAWLATHVLLYSLYVFEGWFRGPRYLYTVVPAVVVLTARAALYLGAAMRPRVRTAAHLLVPACIAIAWLSAGSRVSLLGRYLRQQQVPLVRRVDPDRLAQSAGLRHALVFVNQDTHNRTLFRLWSLGFPHGDAVRLLASAPLCGLNLALDAEGTRPPAPRNERIDRIVADAVRFGTPAPPPAACADDERRDRSGTASYTQFFAANSIDADGRVSGNVIYAIDLGAHNEVLRTRFGDRTWYRFGLRPTDTSMVAGLTPYGRESR